MIITIDMTEREALALIAVSMFVSGPVDGPRGSLQALAERVADETTNLYEVDVIETVLREAGYEIRGDVNIEEVPEPYPARKIDPLDQGRSW